MVVKLREDVFIPSTDFTIQCDQSMASSSRSCKAIHHIGSVVDVGSENRIFDSVNRFRVRKWVLFPENISQQICTISSRIVATIYPVCEQRGLPFSGLNDLVYRVFACAMQSVAPHQFRTRFVRASPHSLIAIVTGWINPDQSITCWTGWIVTTLGRWFQSNNLPGFRMYKDCVETIWPTVTEIAFRGSTSLEWPSLFFIIGFSTYERPV